MDKHTYDFGLIGNCAYMSLIKQRCYFEVKKNPAEGSLSGIFFIRYSQMKPSYDQSKASAAIRLLPDL